jgi:hypothetical protein
VVRLIADVRRLRAELVALEPERFLELDLELLPEADWYVRRKTRRGQSSSSGSCCSRRCLRWFV